MKKSVGLGLTLAALRWSPPSRRRGWRRTIR